MLELDFEITFFSNYHVSAGYGRGFTVDSALLREADGTPVIRGTTLVGLLRDAVFRLLELPPLRSHRREEVLERLFGSARFAKRWHVSNARPVGSAPDTEEATRVRIDVRTRRAEPGKLFAQEEGRSGQKFRFTVTFPVEGEAALDDAAFLVAAARFVRQLGRSRRRGLGECVIHLREARGAVNQMAERRPWEDWFLERFRERWLSGKPAEIFTSVPAPQGLVPSEFAPSGQPPVRVRVIVRLDEPVLVAGRAEAGNQYQTLPYIPGSVVLGVLANLAAQRCDLTDGDNYRDFVRLFLRGAVLFPSLYPAHFQSPNLFPAIPAPLVLRTCSAVPWEKEDEGHGVYEAWDETAVCPICKAGGLDGRLEPVTGFVVLRRRAPYTINPTEAVELHIQVDPARGRVEPGKLYGYRSLSAGQYFVGEMVCLGENSWQRLKEMTGIAEEAPLVWRLGKARRRGYGKATVWLERCDERPPLWIQLPLEERVKDVSPSMTVTMTLLTDCLMVNPWGQQARGFATEWLEEALGLGRLEIVVALARERVVDGFNAYFGMPRCRDVALAAGSAVKFRLLSPPTNWKGRLAELEIEGIGLRRNEGFGRVAFNHPLYDRREALSGTSIRLPEALRVSPPEKEAFEKLWQEHLDRSGLDKSVDQRFGAVARLLYLNSTVPADEIAILLSHLGQPPESLIQLIGEPEYGDRNKPNSLRKGDSGAWADLNKTLVELTELAGQDLKKWTEGLEELAKRLALLAQRKEEGAG